MAIANSPAAQSASAGLHATKSVTINAAFLQEIKDDNLELRQLLQQAQELFAPTGIAAVSLRRAVELLCRLQDQVALHFALEEAYGYFDEPLDAAPRLERQADVLRAQHRQLFVEICVLTDQALQLAYHETPHGSLRQLSANVQAFLARLQVHEASENELILAAFDDDIGVGD